MWVTVHVDTHGILHRCTCDVNSFESQNHGVLVQEGTELVYCTYPWSRKVNPKIRYKLSR